MANPLYKDKGYYHSVRCSRDNPQHVHVHQILNDLNNEIFKSKNQFIIDAIEFYSKSLNQDELTNAAVLENAGKDKKVTLGELEILKEEIKAELMIFIQKEVIALLGYVISNRSGEYKLQTQMEQAEKNEEQTVNPIVADMARLWSED